MRAPLIAASFLLAASTAHAQARPPAARILAAVREHAREVSSPACHEGAVTPIASADRVARASDVLPLPDGGVAALASVAAGAHEADGREAYQVYLVLLDRRGRRLRAQPLDFGVPAVRRELVVHALRLEDVDDDGEDELFIDVEAVGATDCSFGVCTVRRVWLLGLDGSSGALLERSSLCDGPAGERRTAEIELSDVDGDGHRDLVTREQRCVRNRDHELVCSDSTWTDYWTADDSYRRR